MKNKVIRLTSFILTIIIAMSTIFYTSAFDETGQIKITENTFFTARSAETSWVMA